jgi:hypothetical protein
MKYLKRFENLNNDTRDIEEDHLEIKDILTDLEDEHEIKFDTGAGIYFEKDSSVRNLWGLWSKYKSLPVKGGIYLNSININLGLLVLGRSVDSADLEGCKYFTFNEKILPTINTIKSHLEGVSIIIVKINRFNDVFGDLLYDSSKNEYYSLDEFIKKHGNEEFNELEIILY